MSRKKRSDAIMNDHGACAHVAGFSFWEKAIVRVSYYLAALVGVYGMWPVAPGLALGYAAFVLGAYYLLMRYTVCARCPHLFQAGDCLFVPAPLAKTFIRPRPGRLNAWEFAILLAAPLGTLLIPLYWLAARPVALAAFVLLNLGCAAYITRRICRRKCRVLICPLNRNPALK
jgi:hypothetical protein